MNFDWQSLWHRLYGGSDGPATDPYSSPGYGVLAPENEPVTTSGGGMYPGAPVAGGGVLLPGKGLDAGGQPVHLNPTTEQPINPSGAPAPIGQTPETQQNMAERQPARDLGGGNPKPTSTWFTNAPDAMAKADREMRNAQDWAKVGDEAATVVKLVVGGAAGGAAAGGAGAGAGAAGGEAGAAASAGGEAGAAASPGTAAGASSGQGALGDYASKFGGKLGSAYNKYQAGDTTGAITDVAQYAQQQGGGSGGGGPSASGGEGLGQGSLGSKELSGISGLGNFITEGFGSGAKRRSALARLGLLPEFSPQLETGDFWSSVG